MSREDIKMCGSMEEDMQKKIVMGPYFKYDEDNDWASSRVEQGTVRVIEGVLCHAVNDIEYFEQSNYDPCTRQERSSRRVTLWEPYDSTQ